MITPDIKDKVLKFICNENTRIESLLVHKTSILLKELSLSFDDLKGILFQLERNKLISDLNYTYKETSYVLHLDAFDFMRQGGFIVQEQIIFQNLEKLKLELEQYQSKYNKAQPHITNWIGIINTCLSATALL